MRTTLTLTHGESLQATRRHFLSFCLLSLGVASISLKKLQQKIPFIESDAFLPPTPHISHKKPGIGVMQRPRPDFIQEYCVLQSEEIAYIHESRYYFTWHLL